MRELEEKKSKEALVLVQQKHILRRCQSERERARMLQRLGGSRAIRHWSDARDTISVESCSCSMACDMEEVCLECSRKTIDMDETSSEASWTAVIKGKKERCGGWNRRVKRRSLKP